MGIIRSSFWKPIRHWLLVLLAVLGGMAFSFVLSHPAYAEPYYANIHRHTEDVELGVYENTISTTDDVVSIGTNCPANYNLYVTSTEGGSTSLSLSDQSDNIPTSGHAPGSESMLAPNTWGISTNNLSFAGLQDYDPDTGKLIPLYVGSGNEDYSVYYGVRVPVGKTPGIYSGQVLYTLILDETCLKYTLDFDTNGATSSTLPTGDNRPKVNFGDKVDLSQYSTTDKIAKTGYHLSGWDVKDGEGATLYSNLPIDSNQVIDDGFSSVITLVAQWAINSYRLTITNGNVIAIKSTSPITGDRDYNAPITATCTPNTGYHCTGWESSNPELLPSSGDPTYNFNMPAGAFTLTANGAANHYAVVYNGGNTGGTCTASPTAATYDQDVTLAHASCVKEHYVQDGWSVSATGSIKDYNVGATVAKANFTAEDGGIYTLYPHFTINAHTINTVGGVIIDGQSSTTTGVFSYNDIITIKADQPAAGYHFTKWTSNGGGTIASDISEQTTFTVPDNDVTLTVSTSPNHYTVAYSAGNTGSTCTATSTPATYDSNVTLSSTKCTKEGYTQDGWSRTNSATNAKDYDMGQTLEKPNFTAEDGGTYTLYPHFTANQYKLTVKPNGGTWSGKTTDQDFIQDYNSTKFIADPSATPNYIITYDANSQGASYVEQPTSVASNFTGWTKNGTGIWTASNKTWTYGAGDGTLTAGYSATFALPQITKTGYGCQWAMGSASGPKYDGNTEVSVTTNTTFFAVCTIKSYTLTIVNGNTTAVKSTSPATGDQTYNAAINAVCTPNTGYHCTGWTSSDTSLLPSSSDASYGFNMPAGATTLTAGGAINSFILTYEKNDTSASGSTSSQAVNYNTTITIRANGFAPATGKHFVKWNTKADGTGTDYNASQTNVAASTLKPDIATVHGGTVTLFAQWAWNHYTVAYSAGNTGSTCTATSTPATYDSNVTLSSTRCTKEGYTQDGWSRTNSATNTKDYDLGATLEKPNFTAEDGGTYTLYPHFVINSHTVTINKDSHVGTVSGSGTYEYGAVVIISASNFSSGYKFDEWTVDSGSIIITSPTSTTTFFTMPDSDVEITAYATKESYKLTIVNGNSTAIESVSPTTGDRPYDFSIAAICTSKTGYHCTGWESNNPSLLPSSSDATYIFTMPAGAITLTANGTANNYTVAYAAGSTGATCDISGTPATYDQDVTLTSTVCTKDHYHQDGWSTSATSDTKDYDLGQTLTKPNFTSENGGTYTLYPHFAINSHTVTVNEGANIIDTTGSGTYDYGTAVSISATPATGYHFSSWTVNSPASGLAITPDNVTTPAGFVMPDSDVSVTAKGTANNYTIAYGAGVTGGTCNVSSTPATYDQDVTLTSTVCIKDHYHQDGWSTSATGNTKDYDLGQALVKPNFTSENDGIYTLYPHFVINSHNVTVGKGTHISSITGSGTYNYGATVNIFATPDTGYHFSDWTVAEGGITTPTTNPAAFTMPDNDVTVNASATVNSFTLSYSANGGSGTTDSQTVNYGANVTLRDSSFTPPRGQKFLAWNTSSDGTGTSYSASQSVAAATLKPNISTTTGGTVTLYAIWEDAVKNCSSTNHPTVTESCIMPDGNEWILGNNGDTITWSDAFTGATGVDGHDATLNSGICPTGYSTPRKTTYDTLISATGGGSAVFQLLGLPSYRTYWSSTERNSSSAYDMDTLSSSVGVYSSTKTTPGYILCYKLTDMAVAIEKGVGIESFSGSGKYNTNDTVTVSATVSEGYHFDKWTVDFGGITLPSPTSLTNTFTMPDNSVQLKVTAIANNYSINYAAGAAGGSCDITPTQATYDQNVTLSDVICNRTGYVQDGWSRTNSATNAKDYDLGTVLEKPNFTSENGGTYTLYPHYNIKSHNVAINGDAKITSTTGSGTYNYNSAVSIDAATATGYHFSSWTINSPSGLTLVPNSTTTPAGFVMPDSDVSITANSAANNYTVTYAAGSTGSTCNVSGTPAVYDQNVTLSSTTCTKTGYHQDGWSRTNSASNTKDYDLGATLTKPNFTSTNGGTYTLYPHFVINSFTLAYNSNGGSGTTSSQTVNYGTNVTLRTNGFTPPSNKVFKKWNTNSSGTGTNYNASQSVAASTLKSDIGTIHGGTVTLYAIWEDDIKDCSASVHPTTSTGCKMPDNKIWILGNSGNTTLWSNAFNTSSGSTYPQEGTVKSGICPTGYSAPSMANFNNLISTVGGDGTLYSYLGLSGTRFYWSSTELNSDTASHLIVFSSTAFVLNGSKTDAYYVLCYK
ncbi:InlB B-repeat-containing protein [Candidatus Saccharibacteria bacterium]|nr:InlB B-repeat-containing protein [Candidatus Saccharibacteria bacterium]